MLSWDAHRIAQASGAALLSPGEAGPGPSRVVVDSRQAGPGVLFVGLPGANTHGGMHAADALAAGAWGALTTPEHAYEAARIQPNAGILASSEPLAALQQLATAWRRHMGVKVIGVTGSTGKTSTKDLLLALLSPHRRTIASRANFNTEIGLPLEILAAPEDTELLVLEMAMRGTGQIAELARIAEPDIGVIVSVGPVHLELLGSLEAIAAAKAELIAALPEHGTAIVPVGEPLLDSHLRPELHTVTFGPGGQVRFAAEEDGRVRIDCEGKIIELEIDLPQAHLRRNLLAAVAAAVAAGVHPGGCLDFTVSAGRGRRIVRPDGVTVIDDAYNANPMSMRAALDDLAATAARSPGGRRLAVLGDMLELGPGAAGFHVEIGEYANHAVDLLVTVGPLAAAMADGYSGEHIHADDAAEATGLLLSLLAPGDVVLVKGSRGVALEQVCEALTNCPVS